MVNTKDIIEIFHKYKSEVDNFNDAIFEDDFLPLAEALIEYIKNKTTWKKELIKKIEELAYNITTESGDKLIIVELDDILKLLK